jgi:hypothetical protein
MYYDIQLEMDLGDLGYHDAWIEYDILDCDNQDDYCVNVVNVFIRPLDNKCNEVDVSAMLPADKLEELEQRVYDILEDEKLSIMGKL